MHSICFNISRSSFDEKYALYSSMLYRLGFVYFSSDEYVREAMQEAFAWLFSSKKSFKTTEKEKQQLLCHMILICEHKSKEFLNNTYNKQEACDEDACTTEESELLEAVEGLPLKYKSIVHLYLYESISLSEISRLLYKIEPVIKKQLEKGIEFIEMVMEKKLDMDYYCSVLSQLQPQAEIQEELYQYLTSSHRVRKYHSLMSKYIASLAAVIIIALSAAFIHYYPQIETAAKARYAFMNGTICSVTLNNLISFDQTDALITNEHEDLQIYKIVDNSLKQLEIETKSVSGSIDYLGMQVPISLLCYEQDGNLTALFISTSINNIFLDLSPTKGYTENLFINLYDYTEGSHVYPFLLNINTMKTTDFISACKPTELGRITYAAADDSLTSTVIMDESGSLFYCDIKASSITKIDNYEINKLNSIKFCEDGTIFSSVKTQKDAGYAPVISYYEYSIGSGSIKPCYQLGYPTINYLQFQGDSVVVVQDNYDTYSIIDAKSQDSYSITIPELFEEGLDCSDIDASPDERYIIFKLSKYYVSDKLLYIYIYDLYTGETKVINLNDYKAVSFKYTLWYDNQHIALLTEDTLSESSNGTDTYEYSPAASNLRKTTLWIFNIDMLH